MDLFKLELYKITWQTMDHNFLVKVNDVTTRKKKETLKYKVGNLA